MTQLLQNAVYGAGMIMAVAILRGALKDRLLPEARLALWAACLFRLFTPIAPASPLSFWRLFGWGTVWGPSAPAAPTAPAAPAAPMPFWELPAPAPAAPTAPTAPAAPSASTVLTAVWVAVGVVLAAWYALAYARTRRAVGRAIPLGREDARYAALPKFARLREGPLDGAPLTFGVARPTVVLPPGLDGTELACVLAHEGVHARRRDNLWHYAAAAALTVFWWNPAVWLMARMIRRDVELSCDRAAVRRLGEDRRAEYANTLITLSTQAEGRAFCHGFGPKRTEERIISVMKYKKATITGVALTLALVLAVTVGFASNPGAGIPDEESTTSSAPAPLVWMCSHGPEGELLKFSMDLGCLEESLAEHVADGSLTEEGAAYYWAAAKALSQDGVKLEWTVPEDAGLFTDRGGTNIGFDIYYKDKDGNKVYLDLVEILSYIITDNDVFVETEDDFVHFDRRNPDSLLEAYRSLLDGLVAQGELTQASADDSLTRMEKLVERAKNGEIESLMFKKTGDVIWYCERPDLTGADDQTGEDPQAGIDVFYEDPENGISTKTRLRYDAEKGVWYDPETGKEYAPDAEGYLDTGTVAGRHTDDVQDDMPIACPPEAIDKDFYQKYPEALEDFDSSGWKIMKKYYMTADEYAAKVEEHRAELQAAVDKGLITQECMDLSIADAVGWIERVRSGEYAVFYVEYGEGERQDGLTFTFGYESTDSTVRLEVMIKVPPVDQNPSDSHHESESGHHSDSHH